MRQAALEGWFRATPRDARLLTKLKELAAGQNLTLRGDALGKLGALQRAEDVAFLKEYAASNPDPSLAAAAETIGAFTTPAQ